METKHTPGPWKTEPNHDNIIEQNKEGRTNIRSANDWNIARVWEGSTDSEFTQEQSYANARLIASAPTMLNALIEAEKLINSIRQYMPKSIQNADRFNFENINANVIKAAIQKATQP
jgi:hypothetical protein